MRGILFHPHPSFHPSSHPHLHHLKIYHQKKKESQPLKEVRDGLHLHLLLPQVLQNLSLSTSSVEKITWRSEQSLTDPSMGSSLQRELMARITVFMSSPIQEWPTQLSRLITILAEPSLTFKESTMKTLSLFSMELTSLKPGMKLRDFDVSGLKHMKNQPHSVLQFLSQIWMSLKWTFKEMTLTAGWRFKKVKDPGQEKSTELSRLDNQWLLLSPSMTLMVSLTWESSLVSLMMASNLRYI